MRGDGGLMCVTIRRYICVLQLLHINKRDTLIYGREASYFISNAVSCIKVHELLIKMEIAF